MVNRVIHDLMMKRKGTLTPKYSAGDFLSSMKSQLVMLVALMIKIKENSGVNVLSFNQAFGLVCSVQSGYYTSIK